MPIEWHNTGRTVWQSGLWLILVALLVLYFSTGVLLAEGPWKTDQDGHGPVIILISMGIFLSKADALIKLSSSAAPYSGWAFLLVGLLFYSVGHSQEILIFDVGSIIPILIGITLILKGCAGLKLLWFPIFFLTFAIPLPGWLLDTVTQPMKLYLSDIVVNILYSFGYPVANNAVSIYIGQYQLLVKDACVGLNSMYSLASVGAFYIYLVKPGSMIRLFTLLACILPFAFIANIVRVIILVLITYYFGEEAGAGFLHDLMGLVMFTTALLLFLLTDALFSLLPLWKEKRRKPS